MRLMSKNIYILYLIEDGIYMSQKKQKKREKILLVKVKVEILGLMNLM